MKELDVEIYTDARCGQKILASLNFGDGGAGNSGGFGFAGRGLDLSSRTGMARGVTTGP